MRRIALRTVALLLPALLACGPGDHAARLTREQERLERAARRMRRFAPPADGSITREQAEAHLEAKQAIWEWREKGEWQPPAEKTNAIEAARAAMEYEEKADDLAAAAGLRGGKREYDWIILAITDASNRALYASVEKEIEAASSSNR